ncbi:MAG: hypothetical protein AAF614_28390 [Chloroflexota bacterium]
MKKPIILLATLFSLLLLGQSQLLAAPNVLGMLFSDIVIDGDFADWHNNMGNEECIINEDLQDRGSPGRNFTRQCVAGNQTDSLFFKQTFSTFGPTGSLSYHDHYCTFIDTDSPVNGKFDYALCFQYSHGGLLLRQYSNLYAVQLYSCNDTSETICSGSTPVKSYYSSTSYGLGNWTPAFPDPHNDRDDFAHEIVILYADLGLNNSDKPCFAGRLRATGLDTGGPLVVESKKGEALSGSFYVEHIDYIFEFVESRLCFDLDTGASEICNAALTTQDIGIELDGSTLRLDLSSSGADFHEIWTAVNVPYFTPGDDCSNPPAGMSCELEMSDEYERMLTPEELSDNFAFAIRGANECGVVTTTLSNRTGNFNFAVQPGSG